MLPHFGELAACIPVEFGQRGLQLFLPELEEAVLIGADLMKVQMVVPRGDELANRVHDSPDVGAAWDRPARIVLAD